MNSRTTLITGCILAGLAVVIGAFGAHALKPTLEALHRTDTFELAVRYHVYHALALILSGLVMHSIPSRWIRYAALGFLTGILIFSGSLYILSVTGITILGAITPLGGLSFILGWAFLAIGCSTKKA